MTFIEMEKDIAEMSSREKALLFKLLADDLSKSFPGIEKKDGVSGGSACIVRTRIPVWTLELARRNGLSEAQLLFDWPSLRAADLVNAWSYSVLINFFFLESDTVFRSRQGITVP